MNIGLNIRQIRNGWIVSFENHRGPEYNHDAVFCANLEDINREITNKLGKLKINS